MAKTETRTLNFRIEPDQKGLYLTLPFEMPENVERFELSYRYPKNAQNVVDLGLIDPRGEQVGASGSNKLSVFVSETDATPGYIPTSLDAGTWQIMVGAYKVGAEAIDLEYTLRFVFKQGRWLIGDTHCHTNASDGILSRQAIAEHARNQGLDYLIITDHNMPLSPEDTPKVPGLTVIPGMELTLYGGHANFLGSHKPYDGPFFSNDLAGIIAHYESARERGAIVVINHPMNEDLPFTFDLQALPFDLIEIWNGPMRPSNLKAIALWQKMLESGRKIPAIAGSDYHRDELGLGLGVPATIVYAQSASPSDILAALHAGRSYFVYQQKSARLEMHYGNAGIGDSQAWEPEQKLEIKITGVKAGDVVKLIGSDFTYEFPPVETKGDFEAFFTPQKPGFVRLELWQSLYGILPPMPILISNPIWMD